jgi:UDP-N-acetylglucosamine--N-acetylmuramyl-(pentapeptide) pyrophosphoryl-undecaprenol N-acetylglucosamine transferase
VIHDANAVMGRANRMLSSRVGAIAMSFPGMTLDGPLAAKASFTGNPVRPMVIAAAGEPYPDFGDDGAIKLLVFGGSQGARVMADIVPSAVERMLPDLRARLTIVQQARDEDETRVRDIYARLGVKAEVAPFFSDLPARIAASHLIVSRSGASTVAELAAIGRPAILVPLPHALDQDQLANANVLATAGGAIVLKQGRFHARAPRPRDRRSCRRSRKASRDGDRGEIRRRARCRRPARRSGIARRECGTALTSLILRRDRP